MRPFGCFYHGDVITQHHVDGMVRNEAVSITPASATAAEVKCAVVRELVVDT